MKILALDQSTKVTGWSQWNKNELLKYGIVSSNIKENNPLKRMRKMYDEVGILINVKKPDFVVLEEVQFQNNYRTFSQLSQMQGVLFGLLFERNIGFTCVEATAWKRTFEVKGKNRAEQKASAIQRVKEVYGVSASEDEADAIGIGVWAVKNLEIKGGGI